MDLQSGDEEAAFDNVRISGLTSTGISEEAFDKNEINLFPNPAAGVINLENFVQGSIIQLISLEGKLLQEIKITKSQVKLNLSDFENGSLLYKGWRDNTEIHIE